MVQRFWHGQHGMRRRWRSVAAAALAVVALMAWTVEPAAARDTGSANVTFYLGGPLGLDAGRRLIAEMHAGASPQSLGLVPAGMDHVAAKAGAAATAKQATGIGGSQNSAAPQLANPAAPVRSLSLQDCVANISSGFYLDSRFAMCGASRGTFTATETVNGATVVYVATFEWVVIETADGPSQRDMNFNEYLINPMSDAGFPPDWGIVGSEDNTATPGSSSGPGNVAAVTTTGSSSFDITWEQLLADAPDDLVASGSFYAPAGSGYGSNDLIGATTGFHLTGVVPPPFEETGSQAGLIPIPIRWDNAPYFSGYSATNPDSGAVAFPLVIPALQYSAATSAPEWAVAQHIHDACTDPAQTAPLDPSKVMLGCDGSNPLHRLYFDMTRRNQNHSTAVATCTAYWGTYTQGPGGTSYDCDEYPFQSTYEGAAYSRYVSGSGVNPNNYSARPLDSTSNQLAGSQLSAFYQASRIMDGQSVAVDDAGFWVQIIDLPATHSMTATNDAGWTNLWQDYGNNYGGSTLGTTVGWNGGDGAQSVALPSGGTAWFFNDSFWGPISPDGTRPIFGNSAPRNMVVIQPGPASSTGMTSIGGTPNPYLNPNNYPGTLVVGPGAYSDQSRYNLTGSDGEMIGNTLYKFYTIQDNTLGTAAIPDGPIQNAIATFPWTGSTLGSPTVQLLGVPWTGVQWGIALYDDGINTYIYGDEDQPGAKYLHLAKVADSAGLTDWAAWQYFTGGGWSSSAADSSRMMNYVSDGFSVTNVNGTLVLMTNDWGPGGWGNGPAAYYSPTPWGFNGGNKHALTAPPMPTGGSIQYEYRIVPQYSDGSHVLVSYNTDTFLEDLSCMGYNNYDASLYRPRFLDVQLPGIGGATGAVTTTGSPDPGSYFFTPQPAPSAETWTTVGGSYDGAHCGLNNATPAPAPTVATPTTSVVTDANGSLTVQVVVNFKVAPTARWVMLFGYHDDTLDPTWTTPDPSDPNCAQAAGEPPLNSWCQWPYLYPGVTSFTSQYMHWGDTYSFRIQACGWRSNTCTWSSTVTATMPAYPGTAPALTAAAVIVKTAQTTGSTPCWFGLSDIVDPRLTTACVTR